MTNVPENIMNLDDMTIKSNIKEYTMATPETKLGNHPLATIFPTLDSKAMIALSDDIKTKDLQEPIMIYEGKILDGRNRYAACQRIGIVPKFKEFEGTKKQALDYVLSLNLYRRQLNESQRAMAAANLVCESEGIWAFTQQQAADLFGVSLRSVTSAAKVLSSANDLLIDKVINREVPVSLAMAVATLDPDIQDGLLEMGKKAMRVAVLGHQALSRGGAHDGVSASQRYSAKKTIQAMKEKAELKKIEKPLSDLLPKGSVERNVGQDESAVIVLFTDAEMEMIKASMQQSCDIDEALFVHDLVITYCEKKNSAEKKKKERATAELAGFGGTKVADTISTDPMEDELEELLSCIR